MSATPPMLRVRRDEEDGAPTADARAPGADQSIEHWLGTLRALLRVAPGRREQILEELGEHLREHTRDLQLGGMAEQDASRRALEELGGAAELADRFRRAEAPGRRRTIMNLTILGVAGGAVLMSAAALWQDADAPARWQAIAPASQTYSAPAIADEKVTLGEDATAGALFEELAEAAGRPLFVHWERLAHVQVEPATAITVPIRGVSVEQALMLFNEQVEFGAIAARVTGDVLEVSTLEHFDRRDVVLRSYDVRDLVMEHGEVLDERVEALVALIESMVHPEHWHSYGGDLAQASCLNGILFIKAPERFGAEIDWILAQARQEREDRQSEATRLQGMEVRMFLLAHARARDVGGVIQTMFTSEGPLTVTVDERSNRVIVKSAPEMLQRIETMVETLDGWQESAAQPASRSPAGAVQPGAGLGRPAGGAR